MVLRNKLIGATLALGLSFLFSATVFAQQSQAPASDANAQQPQTKHMEKHRRMGKKGDMSFMRKLNLTDAQREQIRAVSGRHSASFKSQREELHKLRQQKAEGTLDANGEARAQALRAELHESTRRMRAEMVAILTPEQRTQLDQLEKERDAHRGEMREHRRNRQSDF